MFLYEYIVNDSVVVIKVIDNGYSIKTIDQINGNKEVINYVYSINNDQSSNDKRVTDDGYLINGDQSN